MKSISLFMLSLSFLSLSMSRFCSAGESIEGYFEKTTYTACWPYQDNYTPKGCPDKDGINIQKRNKSTYYISLHTSADYGHFCSYQGLARWENEKLVSSGHGCNVYVEFVDGHVTINSEGEGCSDYCGARGHLWATDLARKTRLTAHSTGPDAKSAAGR